MKPDPVRQFLQDRAAAPHLVEGGLEGLIEAWQKAVQGLAHDAPLQWEQFLNDLDLRQLIHEALLHADEAVRRAVLEKLDAADRAFRARVRPTHRCAWGAGEARRSGWTPEVNWWYFVKRPGGAAGV